MLDLVVYVKQEGLDPSQMTQTNPDPIGNQNSVTTFTLIMASYRTPSELICREPTTCSYGSHNHGFFGQTGHTYIYGNIYLHIFMGNIIGILYRNCSRLMINHRAYLKTKPVLVPL